MKLILCAFLLACKNLSEGFPDILRSRPQNSDLLDPCIKTKCPKISTKLFSKSEYLRLMNINSSDRRRIQELSWIKVLRKRKQLRSLKLHRSKRSQARTIVSLNTKHKTYRSNKKCHKYAVFKVMNPNWLNPCYSSIEHKILL